MSTVSELFQGLSKEEVEVFLGESLAKKSVVKKGEKIFSQGDKPKYLYILEEGAVVVESISQSGKRSIVNIFKESGTVFGEVYLYLGDGVYDYSCSANENSVVLSIPREKLSFNEMSDSVKVKIINNMLTILSKKALYLNKKLLIATSFSIREKLAKYFLEQAGESELVELSFTREELADYLGVTRPSISRELMNMNSEGLIEIRKNSIVIDRNKLHKFL
ncbi:cAMP-binding domain of CRP or a regulatory subunit of cAMP-dependent protein kinases [Anaerosphaera aminiphila DSM 21120]|uniref:cAMP-binding domain of CRP or a regulatory subunit of cAMP-dependent protein kinases n=1 Tax=Anaerosphaera aminiphila DSM 21120 TaxID=1120995 RepID=A0A1M5T308_9FIRM|nr:Crp/Fnr family transcriptional regulator [Anaerosphaera aminiphila]SHH45125.1 cAMP-binding domain of CRP or a regulatory subunit of cAMP-dependent protein kinases [Anaerosphaera aminiphila DSM 21120]